MLKGKCKVYAKRIISDIDPMLFGNFIEFTHDCINQGMWAELLLNRGFEDRQEEAGVGRYWQQTGYNDTGLYSLEKESAFGHGWSQKICVVHHFGGYKGIEQDNLLLEENACYRFSLWIKGKTPGQIEVRLKSGSGKILWHEKAEYADAWKKHEWFHIMPGKAEHAALEILLREEGTVWLDQCSLMPEDAVEGIWKRVYDAIEESKPSVLRFPGGCFADCYDWKAGVGERDSRPARVNRHWGGIEENNFGTDEFIALCRRLGCEPMICINFGSADEKEAAEWVEYCNGDSSTTYGSLRAKNGHPEPYHVKLWGIGNETWADWEIGNMEAEQYGERYLSFAKAMRAVSPIPLDLILCGGDGNNPSQDWNRKVLKKAGKDAEYIDLHFYAPQLYESEADAERIYGSTVYAGHKYEKIIKETKAVIADEKIDTRIMIGEYNAMYYNNSNREHTLEAALLNGAFLNMFLRNTDAVRIGIFSDLVNGWQGGCIRSRQGRVYGTPSYYVLKLYAEAGLQYSVETDMECDRITVGGAGHVLLMENLPIVDRAAALDREGNLCLFLINRHIKEAVDMEIDGNEYKVTGIEVIEGKHPYSINTFDREGIRIGKKEPEGGNRVTLSPHSVCKVRLERTGGT